MTAYGAGVDPYSSYYQQQQHQQQPGQYPGSAAPAPSALGAVPVAVPASWHHDAYQQQAAPGAAGYFAYPQQPAAYSDLSAGVYTSAAQEPDVPPGVAPQTQSAATWYQTQTQQQQQQQQQTHAQPYYAGYAQYHPAPPQYAAPSTGPQVYAAYSQPVVNYQAPPVIYSQPYDASVYAQPTYSGGATSIVQPTPAEVNYYYQPTPPLPSSPQPGTAPVSPQKASSSPRKPGTAPAGASQAKPETKVDGAATKAKPSVGAAKPAPLPSSSKHALSAKPAYLSVKSKKKVALGDAFDLPSSVQSATTPQETSSKATSQNGVPVAAPEDTSLKQPKVKKKSDQIEWPEALKGYVSRAFASCEGNRDAVEKELHAMINDAFANKTLWTIDWDAKKLPSACTKKKASNKRKREALKPRSAAVGEPDDMADSLPGTDEEQAKRDKRLLRFQAEESRASTPTKLEPVLPVINDVIDWDRHTIVGTCSNLEKPYLRLTSAPDPSTVRPLHILKQSLELLEEKWRTERNYAYVCDQFKSLRQDLTVQRIKNEFTVRVYETHARIALEKSDLGEYNQCQTQLKSLYEYQISGEVIEFTAYRVLYLLHTRNRPDINAMMAELTAEQKAHSHVRHALAVRSSLANSDYHAFFRLYREAPLLGGRLIECFLERERITAMMVITKSYKPSIDVGFITAELGFTDERECRAFLDRYRTPYRDPPGRQAIDCKESFPIWSDAIKSFKKVDIKGQL